MKTTTANPLGTQPVGKLIRRFAVPGIITQLVSSMHNIADQVFIGQGIGDLGVAATNIVFPVATIITASSALIGLGASARFSILIGKNQPENAAGILSNALSLMVLLGVLLSAAASVFLRPMLCLFGATDLIMPYALPYARIICIGILPGILSTGLSYFIRADGSPAYSSAVLLSGAIFNIIFDPVFLFAFDMGISGIALATVLGQLLSTVLALFYLIRKLKSCSFSLVNMALRPETAAAICSLGAAVFATHILMAITQIVQMNALRQYGALSIYGSEVAIAAAGAVGKLSIVFLSAIIGISLGSQPILGYNMGSRQYGRVKEAYLKAIGYATIISSISFLVLQLFPNRIMHLFGSEDPLFYEFAVRYIHIFLLMLFLNALQPVTSTFCTSIGKANLAFWMAVIRQGFLFIPLLLILPRFLAIDGILLAGPISDGIAALIAIFVGVGQVKQLSGMQLKSDQEKKV